MGKEEWLYLWVAAEGEVEGDGVLARQCSFCSSFSLFSLWLFFSLAPSILLCFFLFALSLCNLPFCSLCFFCWIGQINTRSLLLCCCFLLFPFFLGFLFLYFLGSLLLCLPSFSSPSSFVSVFSFHPQTFNFCYLDLILKLYIYILYFPRN